MKIKIIVCFILIGILVLCISCDNPQKSIVLNEVVHSTFYAPQYVAIANGYFIDEGINLILETGWGADKSMAALVSGNADVILAGPEASIYVYAEGKEDYTISFAQLTQRAGNFLIGRENTDFTWSDVVGKTIIGGRPGGMPEMILEYILEKNGITPFEDVEIITNIDFSATAGSFASGIGDFTAEFEPTATRLETEGVGYVVESLGMASGKIPYTSYITTSSYLQEQPEMVEAFTRAIYRGQRFVEQNTSEEIARIIQPYFEDVDMPSLVTIVDRYKSQGTWKIDPVCDEAGYELLQEILINGGTLDNKINIDKIIDNKFAYKVIE